MRSETASAPASDKLAPMVAAAVIVASLLCYLPARNAPFVSDDFRYLVENETLLTTELGNALELFRRPMPHGEYLPLRDLSLRIDWQLFRERTLGYHLHNLVLYGLCCWAVWLLTVQLLRVFEPEVDSHRWTATTVTALFAAHPVHAETVIWVSCRKDLLAALFVLLSLWSVARSLEGRNLRWRSIYLSWFLLSLGMLSKTVALATPIIAAVIVLAHQRVHVPPRTALSRTVLVTGPMIFLALGNLFSNYFGSMDANLWLPEQISVVERSTRAIRILGLHLQTILLPLDLRLTYDLYDPSFSTLSLLLGLLATFAGAAGLFRSVLGRSLIGLGMLIYVAFLLPYVHLISQRTWSFVGERYAFLPSYGVILAAVAWTVTLTRKNAARRAMGAVAGLLLVLVGLGLAHSRATEWRSSLHVMEANSRVNGGAHYAQYLLVRERLARRATTQARADAKQARDPLVREALTAWVEAHELVFRDAPSDPSIQALEKTVRFHGLARDLKGDSWTADIPRHVLGLNLLSFTNRMYERLREWMPGDPRVIYNHGLLQSEFGDWQGAAASFQEVLKAEPFPPRQMAAVHNNLGLVHKARGDRDRAAQSFEAALATCELEWRAAVNLANLLEPGEAPQRLQALKAEIRKRGSRAGLPETEIAAIISGLGDD